MAFRISDATIFANAVRSTRYNRFALSELQSQISSGKRINSLSDDPSDASQILNLRRATQRLEKFESNIQAARSRLEPAETALASLGDALIRLRELAVSADTETAEFDKIQPEVEQLFDEVLRLANTSIGGRYLFGGFATDQAPFSRSGSFPPGVADPANPDVQYQGDGGIIRLQIDESTQIDVNVLGRAVFQGDTDGDGSPDSSRVDIFSVVREMRNRLVDPSTGGPVEVLDALDSAIDQVLQTRGEIGARLNRLENAEQQIQSVKLTLEGERSGIEDLDMISAITKLQSLETTFQASLAVTARVIQPSLLDFLR